MVAAIAAASRLDSRRAVAAQVALNQGLLQNNGELPLLQNNNEEINQIIDESNAGPAGEEEEEFDTSNFNQTEMFHHIDKNGDNQVDMLEAMEHYGVEEADEEFMAHWDAADSNNDGFVDIDEHHGHWHGHNDDYYYGYEGDFEWTKWDAAEEEFVYWFNSVDANADGWCDAAEMSDYYGEEHGQSMMEYMDTNKDGFIAWHEWWCYWGSQQGWDMSSSPDCSAEFKEEAFGW